MSGNPFAKLQSLRETLPDKPVATPAPAVVENPKAPAQAVIRYERKGRGGKEVTVVSQLGLDASACEQWCRELKKQLGCGGVVEGDELVFQGDQRERLRTLLTARGIKKVRGS